jgi:hypothetical protein
LILSMRLDPVPPTSELPGETRPLCLECHARSVEASGDSR